MSDRSPSTRPTPRSSSASASWSSGCGRRWPDRPVAAAARSPGRGRLHPDADAVRRRVRRRRPGRAGHRVPAGRRWTAGSGASTHLIADDRRLASRISRWRSALSPPTCTPRWPRLVGVLPESGRSVARIRAGAGAGLAVLASARTDDGRDRRRGVLRTIEPYLAAEIAAPTSHRPGRFIHPHGDLHVGQVLKWRGGLAVTDFDGNPTVDWAGAGAGRPRRRAAAHQRAARGRDRQSAYRRPAPPERSWSGAGGPAPTTCCDAYRAALRVHGKLERLQPRSAAAVRGRAGVPGAALRRPVPAPMAVRADGRTAGLASGSGVNPELFLPGPRGQAGRPAGAGRGAGRGGRSVAVRPAGAAGAVARHGQFPVRRRGGRAGTAAAWHHGDRRVRLGRGDRCRPTSAPWSSRSRPPAPAWRRWTRHAPPLGRFVALTNDPGPPLAQSATAAGADAGRRRGRRRRMPDLPAHVDPADGARRRGHRRPGAARPPRRPPTCLTAATSGCPARSNCSTGRTASTRWLRPSGCRRRCSRR